MVGADFDQISGNWSGWNDYHILSFPSLRTGAQTLTLSFSPKSPIGVFDWSFAAGGRLYYQFEAPRYSAWEGTPFGSVDMSYWNRNDDFTYSLRLGDEFRGVLYLALYGTYGSLNSSTTVHGNALPVPTPQTGEDVLADPVGPAPLPLPQIPCWAILRLLRRCPWATCWPIPRSRRRCHCLQGWRCCPWAWPRSPSCATAKPTKVSRDKSRPCRSWAASWCCRPIDVCNRGMCLLLPDHGEQGFRAAAQASI